MQLAKCGKLSGMMLGAAFLAGSLIQAQNAATSTTPDNTKANSGTNKSSKNTADKGANSTSDRELIRQIRKAIVDDKSLSSFGHNVKLIPHAGKVTLKGPVHTDEEKKTIEQIATKFAGDGNVTDELTVKGN